MTSEEKARLTNMALRKDPLVRRGVAAIAGVDLAFKSKFPELWDHLTATEWPEDKSPRVTSTVTFFRGPGGPGAVLKDRNTGESLFVSCDSFTGLWEALERALGDPQAIWRTDRDQTGQSARIRKNK